MPVLDVVTSSAVGSLLGMRHALEPDHLAAVSTLVGHERGRYRAVLLGLSWGLGHTLTLVVVGGAFAIVRAEIPPRLADGFEFGVALMLIGLGIRAIVRAVRSGARGTAHVHRHGHVVHHHAGAPAHVHIGRWTLARWPLLIGAVHGLAGSGALTALVLATLPTTAARLSYMLLFGLGSTFGMAVLSGLLGWPLARVGQSHSMTRAVSFAVGCVSAGLGAWWGYPLVGRLF